MMTAIPRDGEDEGGSGEDERIWGKHEGGSGEAALLVETKQPFFHQMKNLNKNKAKNQHETNVITSIIRKK